MTEPGPIRVLQERRFDPPRPVLIEQDGQWWPGWQRAWRLCDDGRGWMADVTWSRDHDWGRGTYDTVVPQGRVREG